MSMFPPTTMHHDALQAFARKLRFDRDRTERIMRGDGRLDAADIVWFSRELEHLDPKIYRIKFPQYKARQLVPRGEMAPWAREYTYRMVEEFGEAEWIGNATDDIPEADATGAESTKTAKAMALSYGWSYFELLAMNATGRRLDMIRGRACRRGIDAKIDKALAWGDSDVGIEGVLNLTGAGTYTLATKAKGGVHWGTKASPNATGDEIADDLMGMASARVSATQGMWDSFVMVLPIAAYEMAASTRIGDNQTTALQHALNTSPHIERIEPWTRCDSSATDSPLTYDRIGLWPNDPEVLAGLVPMEFTQMPVQVQGLKYRVPCVATCAGVVVRAPIAVAYADFTSS